MPLIMPVSAGSGSAKAVLSYWGPGAGILPAGAMSGSTVALDATGDSIAMICHVIKTGSITDVGYLISAKTSSSASVRYFCGVETVSSGDPSGTDAGGSAPANPTQASLSAGWTWSTLATPASVTAGDLIAVRIKHDGASTAPTTQNITVRGRFSGALMATPYVTENTTGSWAKAQGIPTMAYRYDDGTVGGWPLNDSIFGPAAYASTGTPDEMGALFQAPFACKCIGARLYLKPSAATATGTVTLYSAADATLKSAALVASELSTGNYCVADVYWAEQALTADTDYRLTLTATNADTWIPGEWVTADTGSKNAIPGGSRWGQTSRADAGAWTDVATTVPIWCLILSEVTA